MKSLAIEREFGSGGRAIGMKVAEEAGIPYYDTELLLKAAEEYGISIGELEDYDEKWTGSFIYNLVMATNYTQGNWESKIYKIQYGVKETIKKLAAKGPAVFIGRCATDILKSDPDTVKVFIYSSSEEKKLKRIVQTEGISETEAKKLMEKKDKERRNYFKTWTQKEWGDRKNYDMELNTGVLSPEECAEFLQFVMKK
ncbi:MAG: AAA family ATPase [Muricoprocola sp.]